MYVSKAYLGICLWMVKRSRKYLWVLWCKTLKVVKACLYKSRSLTGSQCSLMSAGVICSNLPARSTTRANVFCTHGQNCRLQYTGLDYCNSLFVGMTDCNFKKLQRVQNALAWVVPRAGKFEHITPALIKLHWLPVKQRVLYKQVLITFNVWHDWLQLQEAAACTEYELCYVPANLNISLLHSSNCTGCQ